MKHWRFTVCLLAIFALSPLLMAWGPIGHMAVGYVAYEQLAPAARTRVNALLKLNPEYANWEKQLRAGVSPEDHDRMIFMIATTWPDDIKGDSRYSDDGPDPNTPDGATSSQNIGYSDMFRHRYWHYTDIFFAANDVGANTTLPQAQIPNAETQIDAFRAVLASAQPDELKSYDLVWLLHLIGDIHMPLHATSRINARDAKGDGGGNLVKLVGDADPNLHSYWDDLPGADFTYCAKKAPCLDRAKVYATNLESADRNAAQNLKTDAWVKESYELARRDVYRAPIGEDDGPYTIVPMSNYEVEGYRLAQKRVALAGARLAAVLNHELK